jgi:hypothetical protein
MCQGRHLSISPFRFYNQSRVRRYICVGQAGRGERQPSDRGTVIQRLTRLRVLNVDKSFRVLRVRRRYAFLSSGNSGNFKAASASNQNGAKRAELKVLWTACAARFPDGSRAEFRPDNASLYIAFLLALCVGFGAVTFLSDQAASEAIVSRRRFLVVGMARFFISRRCTHSTYSARSTSVLCLASCIFSCEPAQVLPFGRFFPDLLTETSTMNKLQDLLLESASFLLLMNVASNSDCYLLFLLRIVALNFAHSNASAE